MLGIDYLGVIDARPDAVEFLATLGGVDPRELANGAIRRIEFKSYEVGAEKLDGKSVRREAPRCCPACILDGLTLQPGRPELGLAGRSNWQIRFLRTCPVHGLPLIDLACPSNTLRHDFVYSLQHVPNLERTLANGASVTTRVPGEMEDYVHGRLFGERRDRGWIDTVAISAVARASEVFGAVEINGIDTALKEASEDDLHRFGAAGFKHISGGQLSIRAFLSDIQRRGRVAGIAGPQAVFGQLYKFLYACKADGGLAPIRSVVRQHIVETMAIPAGEVLFGEPVQTRIVHSVFSASREFSVHPKRLRKYLVASGLVSTDDTVADAHATFPAAEGAKAIERFKRGISELELRSYLNVPRPSLHNMIVEGFLQPIPTSADMYSLFDTQDVDRFLDELTKYAAIANKLPAGSLDIPRAASRANCSISEVVKQIQAKNLTKVTRLAGLRGFLSLAVDLDELKQNVRLPELEGLALYRLADHWGMTDRALKGLIEANLIPSSVGKNPVNRCPQRFVHWTAIEAFDAKYITLRALARDRNVNSRRLLRELAKLGVSPVEDMARHGAIVFERSALH